MPDERIKADADCQTSPAKKPLGPWGTLEVPKMDRDCHDCWANLLGPLLMCRWALSGVFRRCQVLFSFTKLKNKFLQPVFSISLKFGRMILPHLNGKALMKFFLERFGEPFSSKKKVLQETNPHF